MEKHRFGKAALAALLAWPLAAMAEAPQAACVPGTAGSPGTMTEMGYPCPEGAGPGTPDGALSGLPTTAETGGAVGPGWNPQTEGAAGVSGSSRMTGAEAPAEARQGPGSEGTESGAGR